MKIDLLKLENWENLNQKLALEMGLDLNWDPGVQIRIYKGQIAALSEIVSGLALLFSHKKAMGLIKGNSFVPPSVLPVLLKDEFIVQNKDVKDTASVKDWVTQLHKDTSFVLFSEDHPITAELFHFQEFDADLNAKKVFSIRNSHSAFWLNEIKILPFSIQICSIGPDLAIAVLGSRYKAMPSVSHLQTWDPQVVLQQFQQAKSNFKNNKKIVLDFEQNLPAGFSRMLIPSDEKSNDRLYDRALIFHTEINAEALQVELMKSLGQRLSDPGLENSIECINACRWGGGQNLSHWWSDLPSETLQKGLLSIDVDLITKTPNLAQLLTKAIEACLIK